MSRSRKNFSRYEEDRNDNRPESYQRGHERKVRRVLREVVGVVDTNELYSALEEHEESVNEF